MESSDNEEKYKDKTQEQEDAPAPVKFDSVLPMVGEFGRYQKRIYILLCLPVICCAMHKLAWVFLGTKVNFRCQLPIEDGNATFDHLPDGILRNVTYPWDSKRNDWSQCSRYDVDFDFVDGVYSVGNETTREVSCGGDYIFDTSEYKTSATIEYKLICKDSHYYTLANTLFMSGVLIGSYLFGDLSDRLGRRPIFFLSLVLQVIFGILAGWAPNFTTFVAARFIVGMTTSGISLVGFVIAMEMVGPSKRMIVGTVWQLFFTAGFLIVVPFAYFIEDWHWLQVGLSLPGLVFLSYYWFLPESIRWLLSKGRNEEASKLLRVVAKENKVTLPPEVYLGISIDKPKNVQTYGLLHLLAYPRLRIRSIIIFFSWFVNSGVYYGLSLNTSNLGKNHYLNFAISGAVEVPAYTFLLLTLNRCGRKILLCGCMLAGGAAMLACGFIPDTSEWNWLLLTCAMMGKMCITASYGVIYILTAESFPTIVRNTGVGAGSMFARVGGILQGYVLYLGDFWKPLPMIVFGAATLLSGASGLLLPETFGRRLPESFEDGEKFGLAEYDNQQNGSVQSVELPLKEKVENQET